MKLPIANPQIAPRVHRLPSALSAPVSAPATLPAFRSAPQQDPNGPAKDLGASSPSVFFTPDGKAEMAVRSFPIGSLGVGVPLRPVYTTSKRWRGVDVFLDVGSLSIVGVAESQAIVVVLYAVAQGVRTAVATGRYCAAENQAANFPLLQKHMIRYRGAVAERFEVQFGANFLPADVTTQLKFSVIASDEVQSSPDDNEDEAGTIAIGVGDAGFGFGFIRVSSDFTPGLELRGVDAVSLVALTAATPRWLHVLDLTSGIAIPANTIPIYAWPLMNGGGFFSAPAQVAHRFTKGISAVISSTARVCTPIGALEDSCVTRLCYR